MSKIAMTPKYLDALKCPTGRVDVFDALTPGLNLRVTADRKSWSFVYTAPGGTTRARLALGTYPATPLATARQRAVEARGQIEAGRDPREAAKVEKPLTIAELAKDRLELAVKGISDGKGGWAQKPLRSASEIERRYNKNILPLVGAVPVASFEIDPHYNKVIDPLVKRGKLRTAGILHTDLVTLMNFAVSRGVRKYSPLAHTKSKDPKTVRKRFLSIDEIPLFWNALPKALVRSKNCQRILMLLLVMGQRANEVAGMKKEGELNWKEMIWTIPAERVKNGDKYGPHVVPISPLAASIIREALAVNSNTSDWLFPNDKGDGPLIPEVVARTLLRAFEAEDFGLARFTPHDLRRTVGTQMLNKANELKIPKFDKYLVLNHRSATKGNVSDEVYDQNDYLEEKREALDKWGAFLSKLVGAETGLRVAA